MNVTRTAKFDLGMVVITPRADDALQTKTRIDLLARHASGDWGDLSHTDRTLNDHALASGDDRIFSAYTISDGTKIWIITERDRSATTILLPEDY